MKKLKMYDVQTAIIMCSKDMVILRKYNSITLISIRNKKGEKNQMQIIQYLLLK